MRYINKLALPWSGLFSDQAKMLGLHVDASCQHLTYGCHISLLCDNLAAKQSANNKDYFCLFAQLNTLDSLWFNLFSMFFSTSFNCYPTRAYGSLHQSLMVNPSRGMACFHI